MYTYIYKMKNNVILKDTCRGMEDTNEDIEYQNL